jgi:hypothetical protein
LVEEEDTSLYSQYPAGNESLRHEWWHKQERDEGGPASVAVLCQLPAAQQLDSAAFMQLLQAVLQHGGSSELLVLHQLPAAQQLSSQQMFQLLQTAMQHGSCRNMQHVRELVELPAAQQLSQQAVFQLLQAAAATAAQYAAAAKQTAAPTPVGCCGGLGLEFKMATFKLCELPGARQLDSHAVVQLLQAAVQQATDTFGLCKLPAARQVDSQAVLLLLQAAVQQGMSTVGFCRLPAASQLNRQAVLQL